jgi:L-lactate dehydrogenase (cytochrome)
MANITLVSAKEILSHDKPEDCWIVIEDEVWDVSKFLSEHPGGPTCEFCCIVGKLVPSNDLCLITVIYRYAGKDATAGFSEVHALSIVKENLSSDCFKGMLDRSSISSQWSAQFTQSKATPKRQNKDDKPPLDEILNR